MPPRLNRRQQRELEELSSLAPINSKQSLSDYDECNDEAAPEISTQVTTEASRRGVGFAALAANDEPEEGNESQEEGTPAQVRVKSKKSKKKKKPTLLTPSSEKPEKTSSPSPSSSKSKRKAQDGVKAKEEKKDDFDEIMAQMAAKYSDLKAVIDAPPVSKQQARARDELWQLLSVTPSYLDGDAELRRFFGSKVVNSAKPPNSKRTQVSLRSQLTRPASTWQNLRTAQGLAMRALTDSELQRSTSVGMPGERWWTIEHSQSYKKTQLEFLSAVAAGDPNGFLLILQQHPWHIDTLLQLSEVFRHEDDHIHATDLVDRALFAYERSFAGAFNITSGIHRIDFKRIENRPLFLAVHRSVIQLQRRGCMRAACEFARLLLSFDPFRDPHGALLHLDFLAPKCGMNDFLLKLWDTWAEVDKEEGAMGPDDEEMRIKPQHLPGMSFGRAVALRSLEVIKDTNDHTDSTKALEDAILAFPSVVPVLADKAGINLPADVRGLPCMRIETGWNAYDPAESAIHLLSHLYAIRATSTWKQPTHVEWMQKTIKGLKTRLESIQKTRPLIYTQALSYFASGPTLAICRHVIVCDIPSVIGFMKPGTVSGEMHAYDPLPSPESITNYDEAYFGPLAAIIPRQSPASRVREMQRRFQQMQQQAQQQAQQRGGEDMGELFQEMQGLQFGGEDRDDDDDTGDVPGGFQAALPEDSSGYEDDQTAPTAAAAPAPGLLQGLWNSLWGRAAPTDDHDESDEDD
ncbi:hypothetical protein FRB96_006680 [Tulasnella sp. 330]|nr:hypothetical protein FRB96_006680 [Tulasnella sp. 330]KAG8883261.1 hypothetical protein FRB97_006956 [Tulasnella sp. 331]KAG8888659.1 hypothetical protein FRB98_007220 [Tulasnella sp. 332]